MPPSPLPASFYNRDVQEVARALLGARLVRRLNNQRIGGHILETEAYDGEQDLACHARAGRTARTEVMYGLPGRAYVYFIYGIHWMLNCVTGPEGYPAAVLIRAIQLDEGLEQLAARPGPPGLVDGPARLCQALVIDSRFNGASLAEPDQDLWIEPGRPVPEASLTVGPRVGIARVPEPWRSKPWRYRVNLQNWDIPPGETNSEAQEV